MTIDDVLIIIQSVMPGLIAVLGVVLSCLKVIASFKAFKTSTGDELTVLKEQVKTIVDENAELKKTVRQLTEVVTKIKQEGE